MFCQPAQLFVKIIIRKNTKNSSSKSMFNLKQRFELFISSYRFSFDMFNSIFYCSAIKQQNGVTSFKQTNFI